MTVAHWGSLSFPVLATGQSKAASNRPMWPRTSWDKVTMPTFHQSHFSNICYHWAGFQRTHPYGIIFKTSFFKINMSTWGKYKKCLHCERWTFLSKLKLSKHWSSMAMKSLWKYFMMLLLISNSLCLDHSQNCGRKRSKMLWWELCSRNVGSGVLLGWLYWPQDNPTDLSWPQFTCIQNQRIFKYFLMFLC